MVEDVPQLKPPETESGTYDELVSHYYTPVYRYLFRIIRDAEVAADLTQDVFTKSYAGFSDRPAGSPLYAWIFRIATNEARQFFRRQRRIIWLPWSDWEIGGSQDDVSNAVVERNSIEQALCSLSPQGRACLLLHAWAGLTCKDIAVILGKSESATKKILLRARQQFRDRYNEGKE